MVLAEDLSHGKRFLVAGGMAITPLPVEIEIVWVDRDGDAVHYRKEKWGRVEQTTIARFLEIVNTHGRR